MSSTLSAMQEEEDPLDALKEIYDFAPSKHQDKHYYESEGYFVSVEAFNAEYKRLQSRDRLKHISCDAVKRKLSQLGYPDSRMATSRVRVEGKRFRVVMGLKVKTDEKPAQEVEAYAADDEL